ncbi:MAG: H/ACA ribonucleoprotein complex subunit GAR1 [Halodesulfurarchaeum sp.]
MRRAGTVVRIAQGKLVVRTPETDGRNSESGSDRPDIGVTVLDENLETVGRVVDVFGPVDHPYLTVSPVDSINPPTFLNAPLYVR